MTDEYLAAMTANEALAYTAVFSTGVVFGVTVVAGTTFTITLPTVGWGTVVTSAGGVAAVQTITWTTVGTFTGAQVIEAGVLATTIVYMTRKPDIIVIDKNAKQLKLNDYQRRMLHDEITGQNYELKVIREIAEYIKRMFPKRW